MNPMKGEHNNSENYMHQLNSRSIQIAILNRVFPEVCSDVLSWYSGKRDHQYVSFSAVRTSSLGPPSLDQVKGWHARLLRDYSPVKANIYLWLCTTQWGSQTVPKWDI